MSCASGRYLTIHMQGKSFTNGQNISSLPADWRPKIVSRFFFVTDTISIGFANIEASGTIRLYATSGSTASTDAIIKISQDL